MGQDESRRNKRPKMLKGKDIPAVAEYMKSKTCKNVILMLGAGVSTAAGIPDFRSPETGLYANLARLKLPYPEAVFEINFFRSNPRPFYTLAQELMPGKFRPTLTHSFVRLLANHSLLKKCFTQNIDTLERRAGVPHELIIEAHGSFATQHCIECRAPFDGDTLRDHILAGIVAECEECEGLVKPDIVFFGEQLPADFHRSIPLLSQADLLIVMGTSLTVHPFASLASMVPQSCPRVLINLDHVGDFGTRDDDVVFLGKTDEVVRELARELSWEDELDALWMETEGTLVDISAPSGAKTATEAKETEEESKQGDDKGESHPSEENTLRVEVDKLTEEIEKALNISSVSPESGHATPVKDNARLGHEENEDAVQTPRDEDKESGKL